MAAKDCPPGYAAGYGDDPAAVLIRGGSRAVGSLGQVLAGPPFGVQVVLVADLDPGGHYARPDVFGLVVDETPRPAAAFGRPRTP